MHGRKRAACGQEKNRRRGNRPRVGELFYRSMDTSRLLLAFLSFGAACMTLWAWMLANTTGSSGTPEQRPPQA